MKKIVAKFMSLDGRKVFFSKNYWIAQMGKRKTMVREVHGSNPVRDDFFN